jgi:hypothetical protein
MPTSLRPTRAPPHSMTTLASTILLPRSARFRWRSMCRA